MHESLNLIERTFTHYSKSPRQSFSEVVDWPFKYESTKAVFRNQAHLVRLTAIERKFPLVWLTKTHAAVDTLTNFLCHYAKVDPQTIAEGYMLESDFPRLTNACGIISRSKLRIANVNTTEEFEEIVLDLAEDNEFSYILCDWNLSRIEEMYAGSLARRGNVNVCWPC